MVKLRFYTRSSYTKAVNTLYCALENGSNLHVNERQKMRQYRARSTDSKKEEELEECQISIFYFARSAGADLEHNLGGGKSMQEVLAEPAGEGIPFSVRSAEAMTFF